MADREKLIDVFMHMGDHIRILDEYGLCYSSTLAEAIEDVVEMLKNPDANGVTFATDYNVGSKWIPVTERLPEAGKTVLCFTKGFQWVATWNDCGDEMWSDGEYWSSKCGVTHWMPLPEPPRGE